jgi:xanthine dehydrogenase accessory factor
MTDFAHHIEAWRNNLDGLPAIRIVVLTAAGSTPREAGAAMIVTTKSTTGTIGGGQLELEAITHARSMLKTAASDRTSWQRDVRTWPLGPGIGQCCGGTVQILFEVYDAESLADLCQSDEIPTKAVLLRPVVSGRPARMITRAAETADLPTPIGREVRDILDDHQAATARTIKGVREATTYFVEPVRHPGTPLFIYGAGHVGRAIVKVMADLDFDIHWVDTHKERFPTDLPAGVTTIVAREPALITVAAPAGAFHLVLTYSHAIDLTICRAALARPMFGFFGLIGSATKRARFVNRLRDAGISEATLDRLTCPIGTGRYRDKSPAAIAVSVAAQLIEKREQLQGQRLDESLHGTSQRILA